MTMMSNSDAIKGWSTMPGGAMDEYDDQGDFAKRHLLNDNLLRLLGPVEGRKILDAGCGQGYLSRILAGRGANVVGVEPAEAMIGRARQIERERHQGIFYVQEDLSSLSDVGQPFDAVVCSMMLLAIPEWRSAMASCVSALRPGGRFVFSVTHPAFENLLGRWQDCGHYKVDRYLDEYEMPGEYAMDFHRPLSTYVEEVIRLGCRIVELCEPGLDEAAARECRTEGIESYVRLPNFLIVCVVRA